MNLLSTSEPVEMQSIESSQVYIDCSRAVSLAGSALLDQILHTKPDQPASRYVIDSCIMCLTAVLRR